MTDGDGLGADPRSQLAGHVIWLGMGVDNLAMMRSMRAGGSGQPSSGWWVIGDDVDALARELGDEAERLGLRLIGSGDSWEDEIPPGSVAVRSPGFPRYGPVCGRLVAAGVPITTPVAWWLATVGPRCRVLGITGTKGKSTAASMAGLVCQAVGVSAVVAGNIGQPIWECLANPADGQVVIVEISSYMAADLAAGPDVALVTSLDEDHVSWHGSIEQYRTDKLRVAALSDVTVIDAERVELIELATAAGATVDALWVTAERWRLPTQRLVSRDFPAHVGATLALAVASVERLAGVVVDDLLVLDIADTYQGLPSRFCTVGSAMGARWVDDTLASNPFGAAASIQAVADRPLILLLGGTDRNVSIEPLEQAISQRNKLTWLVALPDNGIELCERLRQSASVQAVAVAESVGAGVSVAADILRGLRGTDVLEEAASKPVVLFSPAAPTPTRLGNYVTRSAAFVAALSELDLLDR